MALEGGWGWMVVAGAFIINALTLGASRCQSVYVLPIIHEFHANHMSATVVSSLQILGMATAGVFSIPMMRKFGHRTSIFIGGLIGFVACFLSSYIYSLPLFVVVFGGIVGFGFGISFIVSPVVIGNYFYKRRSLATNIASIGGSFGTLIITPTAAYMIEEFSFRGYIMIYAAINLNLLVAGALLRPAPSANNTLEVDDGNFEEDQQNVQSDQTQLTESKDKKDRGINVVIKDKLFWIFASTTAFFFAGAITNILFLLPYAENEIRIPKLKAPLIVSSQAGTEIISRIIYGFLGDVKRIDRVYLLAASYFAQFFFSIMVPFTKTFAGLLAVRTFNGLFEGANGGLSIIIFADIVGIEHYGSAFGIGLFIKGLIGLALPICAGRAVDVTGKESTALWMSSIIMFIGAFGTLVSARLMQIRRNENGSNSTSRSVKLAETSSSNQ